MHAITGQRQTLHVPTLGVVKGGTARFAGVVQVWGHWLHVLCDTEWHNAGRDDAVRGRVDNLVWGHGAAHLVDKRLVALRGPGHAVLRRHHDRIHLGRRGGWLMLLLLLLLQILLLEILLLCGWRTWVAGLPRSTTGKRPAWIPHDRVVRVHARHGKGAHVAGLEGGGVKVCLRVDSCEAAVVVGVSLAAEGGFKIF